MGEVVELALSIDDPDGDGVICEWWQYGEAGTYRGELSPRTWVGESVAIRVPTDARVGETIHIVVEANGAAPNPMKAYERFIPQVVKAPCMIAAART